MKSVSNNKNAFFSMEIVVLFLVVILVLSWIALMISKAAVIQESRRGEALAQVHAEYVIKQLRSIPKDKLMHEISQGKWNFPGQSAVMSMGLGVLPKETIVTEFQTADPRAIQVIVQWQDISGQYKEKYEQLIIEP